MNETVSTRSLWCSAYLLLRGHNLIIFELVTPHNGHFIFKKNKQVEQDIADYYAKNPEVPIRDYLENYNALRDLVMKEKRRAQRSIGRR